MGVKRQKHGEHLREYHSCPCVKYWEPVEANGRNNNQTCYISWQKWYFFSFEMVLLVILLPLGKWEWRESVSKLAEILEVIINRNETILSLYCGNMLHQITKRLWYSMQMKSDCRSSLSLNSIGRAGLFWQKRTFFFLKYFYTVIKEVYIEWDNTDKIIPPIHVLFYFIIFLIYIYY